MKICLHKEVNITGLMLYTLINSLFVFKYSMRLYSYAWIAILVYWIMLAIGICLVLQLLKHAKHIGIWLFGLGGIGLLAGLALQYSIDPYSLHVDRWSAIHNWITTFLSGDYPYSAHTHLGGYGSPFPVWQILHIPFYAMGNVALSTFVIVGLWLYTMAHTQSSRAAFIGLAMLVMAPAFWYEVSVRSDLLANMLLVATLCKWLIYKHVRLSDYPLALGVVAGLILSTRLIAVIPLAVLYGYEFTRTSWRNKWVFVVTILLIFGLTFLPFVLWQGSTLLFFQYSPFVLQTRQGSPMILVIWGLLAIAWVLWVMPKEQQVWFSCALLLFTLVTMACIKMIVATSVVDIFLSSSFDITYFSTALPFVITQFIYYESKRVTLISSQ